MTKDMTTGSIFKHIMVFAIPIILGNIFQLTYNAVDSIIIGKFAGTKALASVGTSDPIMNILILGISGICIGASVIMCEFFGAKEIESLKNEFATTVMLGMALTAFVVVFGLLLSKQLLALISTPDEIMEQSTHYLRLVFLGLPFTCLYNIYSSGLRSVGNSKTPLNYLAFASILNGVLDYIFIALLKMDVIGAGLATVIAEAVSAVLCIVHVYKHIPELQIHKKHFRINKGLISRTVHLGSLTALQQCCQPMGKLIIQGVVNTQGVLIIAAFNAASKIENFALIPEQSIAHSLMFFLAQNRGAKKKERVQKALSKGLTLEALYWILICITILLLKTPLMSLFGSDEKMIMYGVEYLSVMAFMYILSGLTNGMQGFYRGMGNLGITVVGTFSQIAVRVIFTFILAKSMGIMGIAYASALGWVFMLTLEVIYYRYFSKRNEFLH